MTGLLSDLDKWAELVPDKRLYVFLDLGGRESESYTYCEFVRRTHAIATRLRRDYGLQQGDRVLLAYPAGLEVICAFFGCVRAGLIPVPVYPPTSHGFQASLFRMAHIAKDCGAAAILTSGEYYSSLQTNLSRPGVAEQLNGCSFVTTMPWLVTETFREFTGNASYDPASLLFLQYTSGSTSHPKGVMVTHENICHNCALVGDYPDPTAVSWLPQYHDMGLIGYYLYPAMRGGTTYGFSPMDFIQRPGLWLESITKYRACASSAPNFAFDYCLRPGRITEETLAKTDLSELAFLMTAAEPVRPETYTQFLHKFEPYGLRPESLFVAYGLAENTLAVSSFGRNIVTLKKRGLAVRRVRTIEEASEIDSSKQLISCGAPLGDIEVQIVDPEKHVPVDEAGIGEIWVRGGSTAAGYWKQEELSERTFNARLIQGSHGQDGYLRTGDLGFLRDGELYVCGRIKDMIIVRGQNYYPQDVEAVVESSSDLIRSSCVAAFEINEDQTPGLAVVAEVKNPRALPAPQDIVSAIRRYLNVETARVVLIAPRSIQKTSSGKIARHLAKQMWLEGKFRVLSEWAADGEASISFSEGAAYSPFQDLRLRYNLTGREKHTLVEAGVDSIDLVTFMHEIQELLKEKGAQMLASQVDIQLIQQITVAEMFRLAEMFEKSPDAAILRVLQSLTGLRDEYRRKQERRMLDDRALTFRPAREASGAGSDGPILLTGGTGFLGPFLLKSLLEQTSAPIHVLIRAEDTVAGKERLRGGLKPIDLPGFPLEAEFESRVIPVCGDLEQPRLGLSQDSFRFLAEEISAIYHNGATVNYLFNYEKMRCANVTGTNEILRLAFERRRKAFNLVSTTFIFGWATKETLFETDNNDKMELLDFGYSQSKWVSERIVMDAARHGLATRIFRPALISPSIHGGGENLDIAMRLLAFMIKHGIGVDALNQVSFVPADVAADNIVAISGDERTAGGTFHVVRDDYANMVDVTNIIASMTGRPFDLHKIKAFVPEVIKRCTREDLLFPLLDFLIGSVDSISSMEFKRYDSSSYQKARDASRYGRPDPSLEDTVAGILKFMHRRGIVDAPAGGFSVPHAQAAHAGSA